MKLPEFREWLRSRGEHARVLEVGTRRSSPGIPTHHQYWAPDASWMMVDSEPGIDVDQVADIQHLTHSLGWAYYDAVIACSVLEHVERPWLALKSIANVLTPRGKLFIQTHQSFALHYHPQDFWRFSKEALELLCKDAGLTGGGYYEFPCRIVSERAPETETGIAWLNVCIVAEKAQA